MKKLMTVMAAAATALFAIGAVNGDDAPLNATSFEALTLNTKLNTLADDTGDTEGNVKYWYMASTDADNGTLVTNEVAGAGVSRPDYFAKMNQANTKALSLDTTSPLFRHMGSNDGTIPATGEAIGDGIYLDTLVKFTAADAGFAAGALEQNVDKIAIEYVEHGVDSLTDDEPDTYTNFVIRAGYIATSEVIQTNYYAYLPSDPTFENFKKDDWHRLTVRAISNIGGNNNIDGNNVGFVVYVDQEALAYIGDCGDDFSPSTSAQNFYNEIHAIYPSAVPNTETGYDTISAASFSGTGCIDDVVFTTTPPEFVEEGEAVVVPFVADAGVTEISVEVKGDVVTNIAVTAAGTYAATLEAKTTAFTVNVTVDEAHDYTLGSISYNGTPLVNGEVTGYAGGNITITTIRNNFNLFDTNDDPIQGPFQTLTEALAAEGVAKIALAWNYQVTAEEAASEQEIYSIDGKIVLDLNGKTLDGGEGNGFELFYVTGSMKVIDSVGGGKIVYGGNVFGSEGTLLVGDVNDDNGVTIDGVLFNDQAPGYVIRAKVLAEGNTDGEEAFLWALGDGEDIESEATLVGDYWVVTPEGDEPQPTTYTLTIPAVTGASATVTDKATSSVIADIAAIEDGTVVTVTWEADDGYKITAGATEEITMEEDKTADEPTVVAITYATLTITPVENCTIVVSNATEEVATGATFDVDDAVVLTVYRTPAEGYELDNCDATEAITMDQDQAVTAAVKQSGGGADYPSYIDDITDPTAKAAYEDKYDTWATTYSVADGESSEEAFLLNCAPADVETAKANFKIPSITVDAEGNVTVGTIEGTFNGKLQLKGSTDLKNWTNLDAASKSYNFFKYELTY